jgi:8-amino-7-oxononanoate synthase
MTYLGRAEELLRAIREEHRYRELPQRQLPSDVIDFSSNDYLGMAKEPQVVEALRHASRAGSGGARLLAGRNRELSLLEEELADWLGRERALLFSSGYNAGVGTIPVLAELVETILSDRSNHACLIDGIRLARKPHTIYEHAEPPPPHRAGALIVSESVFGMDGDALDPSALLAALGDEDVLLLDEAHALGITGLEGAGLARGLADPRIVVMGSLSKALGTLGGFVAGPAAAIELFVNRARTFIFDTALPPALVLAARIALHLTRAAGDRREALHANVARLRGALDALGVPATPQRGAIPTPVVPILLGDEQRVLRASRELFARRLFVPAIRPPTVPAGGSRLRVSIRAGHTLEQIDFLAAELRRCIGTS